MKKNIISEMIKCMKETVRQTDLINAMKEKLIMNRNGKCRKTLVHEKKNLLR